VAGYIKMVYPHTEVTHPSINPARRKVIMLIETYMLPLSQAATSNAQTYTTMQEIYQNVH